MIRMALRSVLPRLLIFARRLLGDDRVLLALLAVLLGAVAGGAAIVFRLAISGLQWLAWGDGTERLASHAAGLPCWQILLVPILGGIAIGIVTNRFLPGGRPQGVSHVIEEAGRRGGRLSLGTGLWAAGLSAASLGVGASVGREGPVVHLGATLASWLGQSLRVPSGLLRTLLGCGVAAGVAASFNAPIAGVFFALEVVVGHYALTAFAPIVLASVTGTAVSRAWFGDYPAFVLAPQPAAGFMEYPLFVLLGAVSAVVAAALIRGVFLAEDCFGRWGPRLRLPAWTWPGIGGLGTGLLALAYPHVLGVGYEGTDLALQGALPLAMLLGLLAAKLLATVLSVGSGFSGGIFSPALFLGAVAGGAFGILAGLAAPEFASGPGLYATVGMGAVAGAVLGAPISTILIVFEMTADYAVTLAVMVGTVTAAALSTALAGHASLFAGQLARRGVSVPGERTAGPLPLLRVGDVVWTDPPTMPDHLSAAEAAAVLRAAPYAEAVVLGEEGRVLGMISAVDLLDAGLTAGALARKDIPCLTPADELRTALDAFALAGMARLPVVDGGRLVGVVRERDVLAAWHRTAEKMRA
jgi:chloride channel protein, CIC family